MKRKTETPWNTYAGGNLDKTYTFNSMFKNAKITDYIDCCC